MRQFAVMRLVNKNSLCKTTGEIRSSSWIFVRIKKRFSKTAPLFWCGTKFWCGAHEWHHRSSLIQTTRLSIEQRKRMCMQVNTSSLMSTRSEKCNLKEWMKSSHLGPTCCRVYIWVIVKTIPPMNASWNTKTVRLVPSITMSVELDSSVLPLDQSLHVPHF